MSKKYTAEFRAETHLPDIDFSDYLKNILFYALKHFFQDVITGIYVEDNKIIAIEFCAEQ